MAISRKDFLKSSSLILGGVLFGVNKGLAAMLQEGGALKTIRGNTGYFMGKGGTIGWYAGSDAVVMIDSQFPDTAKQFVSEMRNKTSHRIDTLFNTHHHPDHTTGNAFMTEHVTQMVAHENVPKLQLMQSKSRGSGERVAFAKTTFKKDFEFDAGNETAAARYFGPAHTGGDSVIYFEEANVAHTGDLVFNGVIPFIDQAGGGSIEGWIKVLNSVAGYYSSDTIYIFGHSADEQTVTGKKADLISMREYLEALYDFTAKGIKQGKPLEELKKAEFIPGHGLRKQRSEGALAMNIEAAYNEQKKIKVAY